MFMIAVILGVNSQGDTADSDTAGDVDFGKYTMGSYSILFLLLKFVERGTFVP